MLGDTTPLRNPEFPPDPYTGKEPFAFVSYAHANQEAVFSVLRRLSQAGCRLWYDRGIHTANDWADEIAKALTESVVVIFFNSPQAQASRHVKEEIYDALNANKPIVVVELEPTELMGGLRLRLSSYQAISKITVGEPKILELIVAALPSFVFRSPRTTTPKTRAKIIGVDFGTRNSVMAAYDGEAPITIPTRYGKRMTPSVVSWTEADGWIVGDPALAQAAIRPSDTFFSIKSRLGTDWTITRGGQTLTPVHVVSLILKQMREDAIEFLHSDNFAAVVTVPVEFSWRQRRELELAYELAGWKIARMISESTAASFTLARNQVGLTAVIFDLGAGTFDVSVVEIHDNGGFSEVLAVGGKQDLGGDAFDESLASWCIDRLRESVGHSVEIGQDAFRRVVIAAEEAKCLLSRMPSARVFVPYLCYFGEKAINLDVMVSVEQFKELTQPLVDRLIKECQKTMSKAKVSIDPEVHSWEQVRQIVVSGLGARIPGIREAMRDLFKIDAVVPVDPLECVACGAVLNATIIEGVEKEYVLLDVFPSDIGIETEGGVMNVIVEKNSSIPTTKRETFEIYENNHMGAVISLWEGPRPMARDNTHIGTFVLSQDKLESMHDEIEVIIDVDVNAAITISVKSLRNGAYLSKRCGLRDIFHEPIEKRLSGNVKYKRYSVRENLPNE